MLVFTHALICAGKPELYLLQGENDLSLAWSVALILGDCYKAVSVSTPCASSSVADGTRQLLPGMKEAANLRHISAGGCSLPDLEHSSNDSLPCELHFCVSRLYADIPRTSQ